jgi:biopolymer transport protein ExbD
MPVHKPGRVLLHHVPLEFVRNRVTGGGRKATDVSISLVPFIDFLIVLVVFLLMSFSASGELLAQQPNLRMPDAVNAVMLEPQPVIAINPQVVTIDGRRVGDTQSLAAGPQLERIEALVQDLEQQKLNWSVLHPQEPFPGAVILQADQSIDFRVIKKVMFSSAQAGYANISFAVNKKGD